MKVLFIDHEFQLGGAEISMVNIIRYMPVDKVTYTAALPSPGPLSSSIQKYSSAQIVYAKLDGWRWWEKGIINRLKLILTLPSQIRNIWIWYKLIKKTSPDIVHFNLTRLVEPVIAAKLLNIKSIMHCREHQSNNDGFFGGIKVHGFLLNLCSYWIYNSEDTRISLEKYKSKNVNSCKILNGIPVNEFINETNNFISLDTERNYKVLMAATLVPWKNHKAAIEVASYVIKKMNNVEFIFAGKGSDFHLEYLKKLAKQSGIENKISFPGFIYDNVKLFKEVDLVFHTSQTESFGKVYVEAMAASKPIIALKGGAAEEVIENGKVGFLYEFNELEQMADKIVYLLRNDIERIKIGVHGYEYAKAKFSMETHCDAIFKVYSKLNKNLLNE
jgi:glycosyltransferase involved in cell wall biosynthesis